LPLAALVIGSMVPDSTIFLRAFPGLDTVLGRLGSPELPPYSDVRMLLHSPMGVVTVNVLIGLLALMLWWWLLEPAYRDALPSGLRSRTRTASAGSRPWRPAIPALMIGGLTHIAWDQFTHPNSWLSQRVDILHSTVGGMHVATILHLGTGLLGMMGVAVWLLARLLIRTPKSVPQLLPGLASWMFAGPALVALVCLSAVGLNTIMAPRPLEAVVQDALTTTTAGATCAALVMSMLHRACLPITPAGRARMAAPPVRLPAGAHAHRR
jgi:hypothetical protein